MSREWEEALQVEIGILNERIAKLEKDAARYRALRDRRHSAMPMVSGPYNPDTCYTPEGLDAAIDAVLKQTGDAVCPECGKTGQHWEQIVSDGYVRGFWLCEERIAADGIQINDA
jgi:hypothetical protein